MPIKDFIIASLNIQPDKIQTLDTVVRDNVLTVYLTLVPQQTECIFCGGPCRSKGLQAQTIKTLDTAGLQTVIIWKRRRYICKDCERSFSEENPLSPPNMSGSYILINEILKDLHNLDLTYQAIAERHHISVSTVQLYADSYVRAPRQYLPENLGIDEIHSDMAKYGSKYLCVMVDNQNRCLTEILPSRSKRYLSNYFEDIPKEERDRVLYVTMDMWLPYKEVALKYLKNAEIAVDPFHVVEHLTTAFTRLRVDITGSLPHDSASYYLLKKWYKLLNTDYDLDNTPKYNNFFKQKLNYRDLYQMLLQISPDLTLAYQLKEMFRDFIHNCTFEEAPKQLQNLIDVFTEADLPCYAEFVQTIRTWSAEIINSFRRPYNDRKQSNAFTEYINRQLKTAIVVSNGYSNFDRFRARSLFSLNGHVFGSITKQLTSAKRQGKKRGPYKK